MLKTDIVNDVPRAVWMLHDRHGFIERVETAKEQEYLPGFPMEHRRILLEANPAKHLSLIHISEPTRPY